MKFVAPILLGASRGQGVGGGDSAAHAGDPLDRVDRINGEEDEVSRTGFFGREGLFGALYKQFAASLRTARHFFAQDSSKWCLVLSLLPCVALCDSAGAFAILAVSPFSTIHGVSLRQALVVFSENQLRRMPTYFYCALDLALLISGTLVFRTLRSLFRHLLHVCRSIYKTRMYSNPYRRPL